MDETKLLLSAILEGQQKIAAELNAMQSNFLKFQEEMYRFREEMYQFRDEMYEFRDEVYQELREIKFQLDHIGKKRLESKICEEKKDFNDD